MLHSKDDVFCASPLIRCCLKFVSVIILLYNLVPGTRGGFSVVFWVVLSV